jgi:ATP-dependent helicase IRC3
VTVQQLAIPRQRAAGKSQINARPYQHECIECIRADYIEGVRRQLVVSPTGSGKTVMGSLLARRRYPSGPILILAHRGELLDQFGRTLGKVAPGLLTGVVKAERDEYTGRDVVLASMPTLQSTQRLDRILAEVGQFATIIYDEAHHAVAPGNFKVLERLGCFDQDGPLLVGFTATAGERADKVALNAVFDKIAWQRGILWMICQNYLVDVEALEVETDLDYAKVKTSGGDFSDEALGDEMDESGAIDAVAEAWLTHARDRRTVVFLPLVRQAEALSAKLRGLGIKAEFICGETPRDERRAILARVASGETQVITNCGVLTEGFDEPALSCALIGRPTKSRPLFVQMAGRVLRPHPSKNKALLITMSAPPEAGLTTIADLSGDEMKLKVHDGETLAEAAERTQAEEEAFGERRSGIQLSAIHIDLFRRSRLRWLPVADGFTLRIADGLVLLVPTDGGQWRVVQSRRSKFTDIADGLDLGMAQGVGEEHARAAGAISMTDAGWRKRPASDKQIDALLKMHLPVPATAGEASDALATATASSLMPRLLASAGAR